MKTQMIATLLCVSLATACGGSSMGEVEDTSSPASLRQELNLGNIESAAIANSCWAQGSPVGTTSCSGGSAAFVAMSDYPVNTIGGVTYVAFSMGDSSFQNCLSVSGTSLIVTSCNFNSPDQQFAGELTSVINGRQSYRLRSASGSCIEHNGTQLRASWCNTNTTQMWYPR